MAKKAKIDEIAPEKKAKKKTRLVNKSEIVRDLIKENEEMGNIELAELATKQATQEANGEEMIVTPAYVAMIKSNEKKKNSEGNGDVTPAKKATGKDLEKSAMFFAWKHGGNINKCLEVLEKIESDPLLNYLAECGDLSVARKIMKDLKEKLSK
jgi:hypothetical protein